LFGSLLYSPAATYEDNQWHHTVFVLNRSGNFEMFVDGVLVNTTDISSESAEDMKI